MKPDNDAAKAAERKGNVSQIKFLKIWQTGQVQAIELKVVRVI